MKVRFFCDSGANVSSCREETLDTLEDLGYSDTEWLELTEKQKYEQASEWAWNGGLEIGFQELGE